MLEDTAVAMNMSTPAMSHPWIATLDSAKMNASPHTTQTSSKKVNMVQPTTSDYKTNRIIDGFCEFSTELCTY